MSGQAEGRVALGEDVRSEIFDILNGYFRLTREVNLDEDIPACADDLLALIAQARAAAEAELAAVPWDELVDRKRLEEVTAERDQARADGAAEERERIARYVIEQSQAEEDRADQYVLAADGSTAAQAHVGHMAAGRAFRQVARFTGWKLS